jgi:tetratricopeptide (TPR) repeat protein
MFTQPFYRLRTSTAYCSVVFLLLSISCKERVATTAQFQNELQSANLLRGDIALCGSEEGKFGKVSFSVSCAEQVREDFNLAMALLHSFEYSEAEKVFAKVIDADPQCLMGYWGVAMSNFHPLWTPPTKEELTKGAKIISIARLLESESKRETQYIETVAVMFDEWDKLDHATRVQRFERASESLYLAYRDDVEAAILYALALRAASDPTDKSFAKQKKAGEILNQVLASQPEHPGISHYLIHTYDYPELAELALPAARKYASIAATSAHALHMPSHIFTRLGLWNEAVQSNISSISAAKCYAESSGIKGHWDEELHGIDYLVYAYLQQANDDLADQQLEYLLSIDTVSPITPKTAYTFAAVPARVALERKHWEDATKLKLAPANFPWANFPWERANISFARLLGAVHLKQMDIAQTSLGELKECHNILKEKSRAYETNQVLIQIKASEAWINLSEGKKDEAIRLMTEAAAMEDATEKHPVTPGEVVPARELLADMYMQLGDHSKALEAYESDLKRHPGRFNALYGAGSAARKLNQNEKAKTYFQQVAALSSQSGDIREALQNVKAFLDRGI